MEQAGLGGNWGLCSVPPLSQNRDERGAKGAPGAKTGTKAGPKQAFSCLDSEIDFLTFELALLEHTSEKGKKQ